MITYVIVFVYMSFRLSHEAGTLDDEHLETIGRRTACGRAIVPAWESCMNLDQTSLPARRVERIDRQGGVRRICRFLNFQQRKMRVIIGKELTDKINMTLQLHPLEPQSRDRQLLGFH